MAKDKKDPTPVVDVVENPKEEMIVLSRAELRALVAQEVAAARAAVPAEFADMDTTPNAQMPGMALNMAEFAKAIADGIAANTRKKITFGEYLTLAKNNCHPNGIAKAPKMTREYWQNGVMLRQENTKDAEILLLNQITHSGRYLDRKVEVVVNQDGPEEVVHVRWKNKSINDRMDIKGVAKSFVDMLEQVLVTQAEERAEWEGAEDRRKDERGRRRSFGQGKATQDAVDRANA